MCGRFNLRDPKAIVERFGFMDWSEKRIEPRFNIAPSQEILTIVQLPVEHPTVQSAVWGLRPAWLEGAAKRPPPINVRAESLRSPMYRDALRCLIPATGFYEWRNRQPMHIHLRDDSLFAFAGLWLPASTAGGLPTAAIVTTRPNELMATIHTRMPAILLRSEERRWLDPSVDLDQAVAAVQASVPGESLEAYAVKPLVNSWENEGPDLLERAADGPEQLTLPLNG